MNLKKWMLLLFANLATFVAILGVQPTSWGVWYQPQVPEELEK